VVRDLRSAYAELGGEGEPRIVALQYFSIGDDHADASVANLRSYDAWPGDWTEGIAQSAARSEGDLRTRQAAFEDLGVDEFIRDPSVAALDQVDHLADVVLA
jgi:hypothetical protein